MEPEGAWIGGPMDLYEGVETMSLDGKSHASNLPHLADGQERTVYYFQLFPNLLISLHPDYVMIHRLQPFAPDWTAVECEWLFSREAVEAEGCDPSYASDFWDVTNRQDWHACEAVQRGVSSRGYRQGPSRPVRTPSTSSSPWSRKATSKAKSRAPGAGLPKSPSSRKKRKSEAPDENRGLRVK
jgi:Rieske 2Fe-2S family protein